MLIPSGQRSTSAMRKASYANNSDFIQFVSGMQVGCQLRLQFGIAPKMVFVAKVKRLLGQPYWSATICSPLHDFWRAQRAER